MKEAREKKLCVLSQGGGFVIRVQSRMIMLVSIRSVWVDLWNNYEMRELV